MTANHQPDSAAPVSGRPPDSIQAQSEDLEACWKQIGVYGNSTCRDLPRFIHCRNCPVYSQAAAQLLNRAVSAEYRQEWTDHFAWEKRRGTPGKISVLIFRVGVEWLALPAPAFQEVAERRPIHSLPHRRQGIVLGLANVRGELVICVSLGRLLGVEKLTPRQALRTIYDRLLVANWDGQRLAFPVDEVFGMHRFEPQHAQPPPATVSQSSTTYARGVLAWQQRTVGLLDPELLFSTLNRSLA
jgi:chemotaxis-related protein WspD